MTIRMGDSFRDGTTVLQVYGFHEPAGAGSRRILVVTPEGEKSAVDPWDLMENCALDPAGDPKADVVFDSEIHGR